MLLSTVISAARATELLDDIRQGDSGRRRRAMDELLAELMPSLHALCVNTLGFGADAEDALQEALILVYRGLGAFRGESMVSAWAYRITIRVAMRHAVKRRRNAATDLEDTLPPPDMNYNVRFEVVRPLVPQHDEEFVFDVTGTVFGHGENNEVPVGRIGGAIVRGDLIRDADETIYDACDAHSQGLCDVMEAIGDIDADYYNEDLFEDFAPLNSNFIYLSSVEILPDHRGHGVGLMAAWAFLDQFGGAGGLAICEPGPMQFGPHGADLKWQAEMKPGRFVGSKDDGQAKLFRHWSRLGFRPINEKFAVLNLELKLRPLAGVLA